jgi:hypothetical protein
MPRKWLYLFIGLGIVGVIGFLLRDKLKSWAGWSDTVDDLLSQDWSPVPERKSMGSEAAKIGALVPAARDALVSLRKRLDGMGIKTLVGSTRRTDSEQASNVEKGVSATQNSWHLLGRGVDLYVYDDKTGIPDLNGVRLDLYRTMHAEAAKLGWTGLAFNPDGSKRYITTKTGKVWDGGHLQFTQGMTFAQAKAAGESVG